MWDNEGSEEVNAGPHPVAGSTLGSRDGWRLLWGKGEDDVHLSEDQELTDAQMRDAAAKAKVSEAAFVAELPLDVKTWFNALAPAKRTEVREGCAALDGLIPA